MKIVIAVAAGLLAFTLTLLILSYTQDATKELHVKKDHLGTAVACHRVKQTIVCKAK
jgi:hypothetical protein